MQVVDLNKYISTSEQIPDDLKRVTALMVMAQQALAQAETDLHVVFQRQPKEIQAIWFEWVASVGLAADTLVKGE